MDIIENIKSEIRADVERLLNLLADDDVDWDAVRSEAQCISQHADEAENY